jgi:hypothetical protein
MPSLTLDRSFLLRLVLFTLTFTVLGVVIPLQGTATITYAIGLAIVGIFYGLLLGFTLTQLPISLKGRILACTLPLFVIQFLNPMIEGFFFTTQLTPVLMTFGVLFGFLLSLIHALIAGLLFKPTTVESSFSEELKLYFSQRKSPEWAWRLLLVPLLWLVIYFVFGNLIAPIVMPYYADPSMPYQLIAPSLEVVIGIQVIRGFLYLGALLPLLAILKIDAKQLMLVLVGFLYIGGGLAIFVIVETFPLVLRVVHGIEILASSICLGAIIVYLLRRET